METNQHAARKLDLASQIIRFRFSDIRLKTYVSIAVMVFAGGYFLVDLYEDLIVEGLPLSHTVMEGVVFFSVLVAFFIEVSRVFNLSSTVTANQKEIVRLKSHLHSVINGEFNQWKLTDVEKEIALMLIKGMSMREIADARGVKEKSIRQRTTSIYAKANVANRYELTSYFIEDLLAPDIDSLPVR